MLVLEACEHECVCACKFPHIHFLADLSLYLLLKVYIQGIPWGYLHSYTYIFSFSVHILHRCFCILLIICLLVCVPAMSQLKEVLMRRSLHTPNNPWSAHTCSFVHLQIYVHLNTHTCIYQPLSVSSITSVSLCELFCITLSFAAYPSVYHPHVYQKYIYMYCCWLVIVPEN